MRIVVGVNAPAGAHPAVDWALDFARERNAAIELVHVVDTTWGRWSEDHTAAALLAAEEQLRDRARAAQDKTPGAVVESHVRVGSPVNELVAAAEAADFLVIGAGAGGAGRRRVRIARLAHCSVIVVPSDLSASSRGVVVGVDGSVDSDRAVQFAAELADRYGEGLTAVLAWGHPEAWGVVEPVLVEQEPSEEDRLILAESIAGLAVSYPDLVVRGEVSGSRPERALCAAASDARMLVVGSHGHHSVAAALLGSTSESVVAELPCTVAVIRGAAPTS